MVPSAPSCALPTLKQLHREEVPPVAVFSPDKGGELILSRKRRAEDTSKVLCPPEHRGHLLWATGSGVSCCWYRMATLKPCWTLGNFCPLPSECSLSESSPGQALLNTPHAAGVMYSTEFTYLFEVTWDFDLAEWYNNAFKSRHKDKLRLADHSNCSIQLNRVNFLTRLYNMPAYMTAGNPSQWEGVWREY